MSEVFRLVDAALARGWAERHLSELLPRLEALLPPSAEIRHVGATAIPGALTKGDLDLQVRVSAEAFATAHAALRGTFAPSPGGFALPDGASFSEPRHEPPTGIHLTRLASDADLQWALTELLASEPALLARYNQLKLAFDGRPMASYRRAKDIFFAELRAHPRFTELRGR